MARNKYPEETVKKILDVSLKLFIKQGYEKTTVLDIVNNLGGLTRGAFYHHFKSKEEVLDALGDEIFFDNLFFDEIRNDTSLNGLEKIQKIIKANFMSSEQQVVVDASLSLLQSPSFLVKFFEANRTILIPFFEEFIEIGIEDGSIEETDAHSLAELFILVGNLWFVPSIFPAEENEFLERLNLAKEMFDRLGFPIFDDEIMSNAEKTAERYSTEKKELL